jgi:hypothetical protein
MPGPIPGVAEFALKLQEQTGCVLAEVGKGRKTCITTPEDSRWSDKVHIPNPFGAKWFGSSSNSLAHQN